jgi:glyoxylase-like metal-dependent hydrolase (beta-lactamase superfamily II)
MTKAILLSFSLFLLAPVVRAQASGEPPVPASMTSYETVKLADGVYAFIAGFGGSAMVTGNSLVVIGEDGVLVVDSGHFPSLIARQIAQIRQWTDKPVRYLVNTHWHPDHSAGNGLYKKAYPGLQILSTAYTRDAIEHILPQKEVNEKQIDEFSAVSKSGKMPDGKPLAPGSLEYWKRVGVELEAFRPELKAADHALPTTTFTDQMTVYLGKREVRILFLGRANTAGDALVYVPDAKLLATGDLLVHPVPYPFGSFIGEWIGALKKVDAIDASTILPGHGPVMHDKEYLRMTITLLEQTKRQTDSAVRQGLSLEQTRKKVDVSALKPKFVGADKAMSFFFDSGYLATAVGRAYREAKEGPLKDEN